MGFRSEVGEANMVRLLHDIASHRSSAAAFGTAWLAVGALTALTWHDGMTLTTMAAQAVLPLVAGALVAWWRFTPSAGDDHSCGMLAGAIVAFLDFTIVFFLDWQYTPTNTGAWDWGVFGLWIVTGAIFAFVGGSIGFMGGVAVQTLLRAEPTARRAKR